MNTQYLLGARPFVSYALPDLGRFGGLSADAYLLSTWQRRYASRESYLSEASEAAPLFQMYGWGASLSYEPVKYVSVSVGIDHGGSVLRNGIVNTLVAHRDETELGVSVIGRYQVVLRSFRTPALGTPGAGVRTSPGESGHPPRRCGISSRAGEGPGEGRNFRLSLEARIPCARAPVL